MRVIGVIAMVLAILLFVAAGATGALRWIVTEIGIDTMNSLFGEEAASPFIATVKDICKSLQLDLRLLMALIVASAVMFVLAIFSFTIVNIAKKRAIKKAFNSANKAKKNDGDSVEKAIPFLAAGVVVTAAIVAAVVVLKKRAARDAD